MVSSGDVRVQRMNELQIAAHRFLSRTARIATWIEMIILVLSVATSGALWALAADALPKSFGWVGAAVSTVVTFLTIYTYSSGIQQKRKKALVLVTEITQYLGVLRSAPLIPDEEFWNTYKRFENGLTELKYSRED
jgi:hypothetical protein